MTTRTKKRLYVIAATVCMLLLVGAAVVTTIELGPSPFMLPFLVGLWLAIIWAIITVVRDYKALDD